jgi:hypothetical protein
MKRGNLVTLPVLLAMILMAFGPIAGVQAADGPPNYQLQFLGTGTPTAINNSGIVIGTRLVGGSTYDPLVSLSGSPWAVLPVPGGAMSTFPTDVNDAGVIVGVSYDTAWNATAVRWTPAGGGYQVEILPRLAGDASSYATAINNLGQIIGARRVLGYVPASSSGWLYSDAQGVVDLAATYGLWTYPTDINDQGQLISGVEKLDLSTGALVNIGGGPANYQPVTAVAINAGGGMAGYAPQQSTSLNIVSVFRNDGVNGWQFVAGTSRYTSVSSLNNLGDIGYSELGAGLYLNGLGTYALGSLLDPAVIAAGWAITGSGAKINDQRAVATVARNSVTGENGGVLLTATGALQPPSAPINLQGAAHAATRMEPYNSINLTWETTSPLTRGYELERSEAGAGVWMQLALTPPGTATQHTDATVQAGLTYEYRVRAVGLAGNSAWSNTVLVAAPATPLDVTPPVVTLLTPANGASVSGTVTVSAQTSDNVAVEYFEISFWNQYLGQKVILGSMSGSGTLTVNWDTRALTPAAYTVSAFAYDTLGNWTQTDITVNVAVAAQTMKVTSITLSGTVSGSKASITGSVYVKDAAGRAVSKATVAVRWTLPGGSTRTATAVTDNQGRARFTYSGARGTYTLTVTNVTRSGYTFDAAGSVLSKSITK